MAERIETIRSKKHPGAVFFKVKGSQRDFICKVYPEHEWEARVIRDALEQAYRDEGIPETPGADWRDRAMRAARPVKDT